MKNEAVIARAFQNCVQNKSCKDCPIECTSDSDTLLLPASLATEVVEIVRKHVPITMIDKGPSDLLKDHWNGKCPKCDQWLCARPSGIVYCQACGQALKWPQNRTRTKEE